MWEKGVLFTLGLLFGKCDPTDPTEPTYPAESEAKPPQRASYGARDQQSGQPIGGGKGYDDWQPSAHAIHTLAELKAALVLESPLIYIADDAVIDVDETLVIPEATTLASGRGRDGSQGGKLRMLLDGTEPMLRPLGDIRLTGLRLEGPDPSEHAPTCDSSGRAAIRYQVDGTRDDARKIVKRRFEVDNNEIFAWTVAVSLEGVTGPHVHHNEFHHNRRHAHRLDCAVKLEFHALGYGVAINSGHVLIEANLFHENRHAIASHGSQFTAYEAYDNVVFGENVSHSFDMHGGVDRDDGTYIAGQTIVIAFNSLFDTGKNAVNIRGWPTIGAYVYRNELAQDIDTVQQTKVPVECSGIKCGFEHQNMFVFDNLDHVDPSPEWLEKLLRRD